MLATDCVRARAGEEPAALCACVGCAARRIQLEDHLLAIRIALGDLRGARDGGGWPGKAADGSSLAVAAAAAEEELVASLDSLRLATAIERAPDDAVPAQLLRRFEMEDELDRRGRQLAEQLDGRSPSASPIGRVQYRPAAAAITSAGGRRRIADSPSPRPAAVIRVAQTALAVEDRPLTTPAPASPRQQAASTATRALQSKAYDTAVARLSSAWTATSSSASPAASSSASASSGVSADPFSQEEDCSSCLETRRCTVLPCRHPYCRGCIAQLVASGLRDRSLLPIRCCRQEAPLAVVTATVDALTLANYQRLCEVVYEAPLLPAAESKQGTATAADQALLDALCHRCGWTPCPRCRTPIEKLHGCNHIICLCRHEFCYRCAAPWYTCGCDIYSIEEIEAILDQRLLPDALPAERARARRDLQTYVEHDHSPVFTPGRAVCADCGWYTDAFHFACSVCRQTRCKRCTYNRPV
ncbi:hypothetical protein HK405_005066 [Cladochytrium tenue]|nr:hypothetical protein HK405_005066 [Cladochytrium tenue]